MICKICGEEIGPHGPCAWPSYHRAIEDENGDIPPVLNQFCNRCYNKIIKWHGRNNGKRYSFEVFQSKPGELKITNEDIAMYVAHILSIAVKRMQGGRPYERCACLANGGRCDRLAETVHNGVPVCKQHLPILLEGRAKISGRMNNSPVMAKAKELLFA